MIDILIVVDMQNDFVDGALGSKEAQAIVPNVTNKIISWAKEHPKGRIYVTMDTHYAETYLNTIEGKKLPIPHCIYGTEGRAVYPSVQDALNQAYAVMSKEPDENPITVIGKTTFGSMDLIDDLNWDEYPISSFEIMGLCTDICVVSNALLVKASFPNTEITVDASCCAGVTPEKHKAALEVMKSCHINVVNE